MVESKILDLGNYTKLQSTNKHGLALVWHHYPNNSCQFQLKIILCLASLRNRSSSLASMLSPKSRFIME